MIFTVLSLRISKMWEGARRQKQWGGRRNEEKGSAGKKEQRGESEEEEGARRREHAPFSKMKTIKKKKLDKWVALGRIIDQSVLFHLFQRKWRQTDVNSTTIISTACPFAFSLHRQLAFSGSNLLFIDVRPQEAPACAMNLREILTSPT